MHNHKTYRTGSGEQPIEIECNDEDAYALASFLFADFPGSTSSNPPITYDILSVGRQPMLSLWHGDRQLYFGESRYQLAYILMNEVIYYCINTNNTQHALHAGAVYKDGQCIILPGKSGNGKSTLTAWLTANGYQYLTDELLFLSNDGMVSPLTRPVNLKVNPSHISWLFKEEGVDDQIIMDEKGSMIPHRLLNPQFVSHEPQVTHIIFPEYKEGAELILAEITPAKSSLNLIQSHVNARNLSGHGIAELTSIVRGCSSYKLTYSSFDDLDTIFNTSSNEPIPYP